MTNREASEMVLPGFVGNLNAGLSHSAGLAIPDLDRGLISYPGTGRDEDSMPL